MSMNASKNEKSNARSWLVIALVALVFLFLYKIGPEGDGTKEMSLLDFYGEMQKGTLVEPVTRVVDRDEGKTYLEGEYETGETDGNGEPKMGQDGKPVRARYRVALVPGESAELMQDLLEAKIDTKVKDVASAISPFVMQLLSLLLFLFLFYWIFIKSFTYISYFIMFICKF